MAKIGARGATAIAKATRMLDSDGEEKGTVVLLRSDGALLIKSGWRQRSSASEWERSWHWSGYRIVTQDFPLHPVRRDPAGFREDMQGRGYTVS